MKTLIKNIDELYTMQNNNFRLENVYITIMGSKIDKIGTGNINEESFDKVIDASGCIVLPGFINTHTHSAMSLVRGYADDLPLQQWLEDKIWPFEAKLSPEDIYWGSLLAIIEMLKTGTTTFVDMYFEIDKIAEAVALSGIRSVLSEGLIEDVDGIDGLKKAELNIFKAREIGEDRITGMLAPHAPYTCSPPYLQKIIARAEELNVPLNIHVAETRQERDDLIAEFNCSPVRFLEKQGTFSRPVLAAHCVHVDEEELEILKSNNVGVAFNPKSNMKLASGTAPAAKILDLGINIGFGTDGAGSNNNLNLIEEARIGSYLQKVSYRDPTLMNVKDIGEMLTVKGARAANLNHMGQIRKGYLADLILIDINSKPYFHPHHNNLSNLFYAAGGYSVDTVIINGKIVLKDGRLVNIEEEEVYHHISQIVEKLK
ncbi:MAG: amidohydrolase [Halanaerobiales bacterium]